MGLFNFFKKSKILIDTSKPCNYADICSYDEAEQYYQAGQLGKLYLIGLTFGGDDSPVNTLYAPQDAVVQKEAIDHHIESQLREGLKLQYRAFPEYKENSFIPSRILIEIDGDKTYSEEIEIW
ncbi:MAG: hypothetical protein LBI73_12170 [Myroides sp.]|jgi:hypothetical protein|nr:hypothetical protein [Myroides sp.]